MRIPLCSSTIFLVLVTLGFAQSSADGYDANVVTTVHRTPSELHPIGQSPVTQIKEIIAEAENGIVERVPRPHSRPVENSLDKRLLRPRYVAEDLGNRFPPPQSRPLDSLAKRLPRPQYRLTRDSTNNRRA